MFFEVFFASKHLPLPTKNKTFSWAGFKTNFEGRGETLRENLKITVLSVNCVFRCFFGITTFVTASKKNKTFSIFHGLDSKPNFEGLGETLREDLKITVH